MKRLYCHYLTKKSDFMADDVPLGLFHVKNKCVVALRRLKY